MYQFESEYLSITITITLFDRQGTNRQKYKSGQIVNHL